MKRFWMCAVLGLGAAILRAAPPAPDIYMPAEGQTDLILRPKVGMNFDDPGYFTGKFRVLDLGTGAVHTPWTDMPFAGQTLFYWQLRDCLDPGRRYELQVKLVNTRTGEAGPAALRRFRTRTAMSAPAIVSPANQATGVSASLNKALVNLDDLSTSSIVEVRRENDGVVVASNVDDADGNVSLPALHAGATYLLQVTGANSCERSPVATSRFTVAPLPAAALADVPASAPAGATVTTTSNAVPGATRYEWELRNAAGSVVWSASSAGNSAQPVIRAEAASSLALRVRAVGPFSTGGWSAQRAIIATNPLATPTGAAWDVDEDTFCLTWSAVNGATSYDVTVFDAKEHALGTWATTEPRLCADSPAGVVAGAALSANIQARLSGWTSAPGRVLATPRAAPMRYALSRAPGGPVALGAPVDIELELRGLPAGRRLELQRLSGMSGWTRLATWAGPRGSSAVPERISHRLVISATHADSGYYRLAQLPLKDDARTYTYFRLTVLQHTAVGLVRDHADRDALDEAIVLPRRELAPIAVGSAGFQWVGFAHPDFKDVAVGFGAGLRKLGEQLHSPVYLECLPFTFNRSVRPLENVERMLTAAFRNGKRQAGLALKVDFFFHGESTGEQADWYPEYYAARQGMVASKAGEFKVTPYSFLSSYGDTSTAAGYALPMQWDTALAWTQTATARAAWNTAWKPDGKGQAHLAELIRRTDLLADFLVRLRADPLYASIKPHTVLYLSAELEKRNRPLENVKDPYRVACKLILARLRARGVDDVLPLGFVRHGTNFDDEKFAGETHQLDAKNTSPGEGLISSNDGDVTHSAGMSDEDFQFATKKHLEKGKIFAAWHQAFNLGPHDKRSPWDRKLTADQATRAAKVLDLVFETQRSVLNLPSAPAWLSSEGGLSPLRAASPSLVVLAEADGIEPHAVSILPMSTEPAPLALGCRPTREDLEFTLPARSHPVRLEWASRPDSEEWEEVCVVAPGVHALRVDPKCERGYFRLAALEQVATAPAPELEYQEGEVRVRWESEDVESVMDTLLVDGRWVSTNAPGTASARLNGASSVSVARWTSSDVNTASVAVAEGAPPAAPVLLAVRTEEQYRVVQWQEEPAGNADGIRLERLGPEGDWIVVAEDDPREGSFLTVGAEAATGTCRLVFVNRFGRAESQAFLLAPVAIGN